MVSSRQKIRLPWISLTHSSLGFPPEIVVWTEYTFDYNLKIKNVFAKKLKEICQLCYDEYYPSNTFLNILSPERFFVVWTKYTFDNNLRIKNVFAKELKERCQLCYDEYYSFKYFPKYTFACEILPSLSDCFLPLQALMG